ncbi:MAG: transglycosylase SLT domain-containing protein [Eubacterium sp.]|nr:transglycosylase SLT domain-containing protein [Eubacterium sp.]
MKMKKTDFIFICCILVLVAVIVIFTRTTFKLSKTCTNYAEMLERKEVAMLSLEDVSSENSTYGKYDFIDGKIAAYIESLCLELEIEPDLMFAVLMVENPEFDPEAIHRNENGTIDCGLFQLNDRYIWTTFKDSYWIDGVELDPFNWKHNSYLAIHHIKYLYDKLKITDEVIMAYNCGIGAVMNDNVPASTRVYHAKVKNNMKLLQNYSH